MQQYVRVEKGRLEDAERRADTFMKAMIEANERVAKLTDENERLRVDLARSRPTASGGTEADLRAIMARVDFGRNPVITAREREAALADVSDALRALIGRSALAAPAVTRGAGVGEEGS